MNSLTSPVDIRPDHLEIVQDILREHLPVGVKVWVFGSRANWTTKDSSDLDIALEGESKLSHKMLGALKDAFEDSTLPYTVDVVDLNAVGHAFKQIVKEQRTPLSMDGDGAMQRVRLAGTAVSGVPSARANLTVTPGKWSEVALGECSVLNDSTYSPKEAWPIINYLDTGNITENRVSDIQQLVAGVDEIPSRARRKVRPGDIVYSTVRPNQKHFGLLKNIPDHFLASTGFAVMRGRDGIADTGFLYWFLAQDHIVDYLHSIAENSTSAYPSIRPSDLEQLTVSLPPLPEQRAIAHVLGTLDDKIELNRRMNETLEAMARALFKSWFVDFEPVRAKMEGCWRRGESLPGLPAEHYDLFPDRLVDSELGETPEGWAVGVLNDAIELLSGGTPKTSIPGYWGGDIPWYTAKDAPNGSDVFALETERTITQSGVENSATRILAAGTTVITARGTVGRLACLGVPMAMNQTCYGIRGAHGYPDFFTYWNLRTAVDELQTRTHGTIFDTITRQTFALVEKALAPVKLTLAFEAIVEPIMAHILNNLKESRSLTARRDELLPRLVSGEVGVGSAIDSTTPRRGVMDN